MSDELREGDKLPISPEWLAALLKFIPKAYETTMAVATAIVMRVALFMPDRYVGTAGLGDLRRAWLPWLAGAWLLFVIAALALILGGMVPWFVRIRERNASIKALQQLPPDQRAVLRGYVEHGTGSQHFETWSGEIDSLVKAEILYPVLGDQRAGGHVFNIELWMYDYLKKHPRLLDVPQRGPAREGEPPVGPPALQ